MLVMMIDVFQISSDQKYEYDGRTGFIESCTNNNQKVAQILIEKYPSIVRQKDTHGFSGFIWACLNNNIQVVKLLTNNYLFVIQ